ncbi:MAG: hypothetical protein HYW62_00175, partial [Candidatus Levybacteria bacterium]|nr:hypothetical protein [Candidatus Levybacteria bacterium]
MNTGDPPGLGYDYCSQNAPVGICADGSYAHVIQCCSNPPTPTPTSTPTPTGGPTPTPTPTLWLINGTVYYDNDNNGVFDIPAGDTAYGSGANVIVKDVTANELKGPYTTDSFGVYQTPRIWPDQHTVNVTLTTSPPLGCTVTSINPASRLMTSDQTVNYAIYCPSPTPTPTNIPTPTITPTPCPGCIPTNTPTPAPTSTPAPTAGPTSTPTPTPTPAAGCNSYSCTLNFYNGPSCSVFSLSNTSTFCAASVDLSCQPNGSNS